MRIKHTKQLSFWLFGDCRTGVSSVQSSIFNFQGAVSCMIGPARQNTGGSIETWEAPPQSISAPPWFLRPPCFAEGTSPRESVSTFSISPPRHGQIAATHEGISTTSTRSPQNHPPHPRFVASRKAANNTSQGQRLTTYDSRLTLGYKSASRLPIVS